MLYRLSPFTPRIPSAWNSQPPTTAPTIPRRMSMTTPSPVRLTILLAMKPAISPRIIHTSIDMILFQPQRDGMHGSKGVAAVYGDLSRSVVAGVGEVGAAANIIWASREIFGPARPTSAGP